MPWLLPLLLSATALLLLSAYVRRRSFVWLVGPVFFYDLLRLSRRGRFLALRTGYAALLLVLILLFYRSWAARYGTEGFFDAVRVPVAEMPRLAERLFTMFMAAQFVAVFLLTPIYMAGSIADEKERRTLELLFASGLSSREIVLGKLAARLGHVLIVIMAGLPVLVLLPLWGGVDPNAVIAGFLATGLTALALASFGVWASVRVPRTLDATLLGYLGAFIDAWLLVSLIPSIPALGPWLYLLIVGAMQGSFAVAFAASAIANLRRIGLDPTLEDEVLKPGPLRPPPIVYYRPRPRPPVRPLRLAIWKERFVERSFLEDHPVITGVLAMAFVIAGAPLVTVLIGLSINSTGEELNRSLRPWLVALAAPAPLLLGLTAAWRISRERERGTLDGLLCTAMEWRYWMLAKVLMPVRNISFLLAAAALVGVAGWVRGAFNIVTAPFFVTAVAMHLGFAAALGLFISARCTSTVRAMILTVLILLGFALVPLFLGPAALLSPPVALWELSVGYDYEVEEIPRILAAFAATAAVYGTTTWFLWRGALRALHG